MSDELQKAVETAVKMEEDSIDFYTDAAKKTGDKLGRSMFESLVKDEQRHLRALEHLLDAAAPSAPAETILPSRGHSFKSEISTVFAEARKGIGERVQADAGDLTALKVAIDLEKDGHRFYGESAAQTDNETVKNVYLALQREEGEHLNFLQNTFEYLEDSRDWFLWEEQGLLDGG